MLRLAAIGDIHARAGKEQDLKALFEQAEEVADLLVIAGDLTDHGLEADAQVLAKVLDGVRIPIVAVLGNHDFHHDQNVAIERVMEGCGVTILDGDGWIFEHGGVRLGLGGCVGFGGGFRPYNATPFGEPEWKHLYEKITEEAMKLDHALAAVRDADYIVGVTHYSPTVDTMGDEPAALHPYLGSSELGDVLERHQVIFAVHGHAHRGRCQGCTQNGVAVYNVAMPIVGRPLVWRFEPRAGRGAPAPPQPMAVGAAMPSD